MLLIQSINYDYATPIFLTFLQASKMNIHIKKGSTSFPVYHIAYMYYSPNAKERISIEKYEKLDESEQKNYYMIQTPKCYNIFNLDQTDYKDKYPEEWSEMLMRHQEIPVGIDTVNSYSNDMLDEVITQQSWICPILEEYSNKAYYSPSQDIIKLPQKNQFHRGKSYYATALHEMIHSTGSKDRLNRIKTFRSDAEYAKEELVAELSSALLGFYLGIETTIREDHAQYLKNWLEELAKDPAFLLSILSDVVKAVKFTCSHLEYNPFGIHSGTSENYTKKVTEKPSDKKLTNELVIID